MYSGECWKVRADKMAPNPPSLIRSFARNMRILIFLRGSDAARNARFALSLSSKYGRENTENISVDRLLKHSLRSAQDQRNIMLQAAESSSIRAAQSVAQRKPLIILSSPIAYPINCLDAISEVCSSNEYGIRQMIVPSVHEADVDHPRPLDFSSHILGREQKIFDRYLIPYINEAILESEIATLFSTLLTSRPVHDSITQIPS